MGQRVDYFDRVRRYFWPKGSEWVDFIIASLVLGFIISFKDWGIGESVDFNSGLVNLLWAVFIVMLSLFVHDSAQRLWALGIGYRVEVKKTGIGLGVGLFVVFISNGSFWLLIPSWFFIHHLTTHRLGWFRYGINYFGQGLVALAGSIAIITLLFVFKLIGTVAPSALIDKAIMFNVIYVITNLIPIPPLDGSKIYWGSRMLYAFMMPGIVASAILLMLPLNPFLALGLSGLIAFGFWFVYYVLFEQNAWVGPN
jgi:hypothetical protein